MNDPWTVLIRVLKNPKIDQKFPPESKLEIVQRIPCLGIPTLSVKIRGNNKETKHQCLRFNLNRCFRDSTVSIEPTLPEFEWIESKNGAVWRWCMDVTTKDVHQTDFSQIRPVLGTWNVFHFIELSSATPLFNLDIIYLQKTLFYPQHHHDHLKPHRIRSRPWPKILSTIACFFFRRKYPEEKIWKTKWNFLRISSWIQVEKTLRPFLATNLYSEGEKPKSKLILKWNLRVLWFTSHLSCTKYSIHSILFILRVVTWLGIFIPKSPFNLTWTLDFREIFCKISTSSYLLQALTSSSNHAPHSEILLNSKYNPINSWSLRHDLPIPKVTTRVDW